MCKKLEKLKFKKPITHVYNPLEYAKALHLDYLRRYSEGQKRALLLGMNPGPFGMAQTGVPFGEIAAVRDWLRLEGVVAKPAREHPKRQVQGLACARSEVSGKRLWGWAQENFKTPDSFFRDFFVINYCPLVFMESSGKNFTHDKLPRLEQQRLFAICDWALARTVEILKPSFVIGVGAFAQARAQSALKKHQDLRICKILHPSPASPAANRGWSAQVTRKLNELQITL